MAKFLPSYERALLLCIVYLILEWEMGSVEGVPNQGNSDRSKPGIVDGAGYAIGSTAFSQDGELLAMEANAAEVQGGSLGQVTLTPFVHSRSQSWGVAFYGGKSAELSSSINRDNLVTTYYNEGSTLPRSRHYFFHSDDSNETFRIQNEETGLCLEAAVPQLEGNKKRKRMDDRVFIQFSECDEESVFQAWVFQRTG